MPVSFQHPVKIWYSLKIRPCQINVRSQGKDLPVTVPVIPAFLCKAFKLLHIGYFDAVRSFCFLNSSFCFRCTCFCCTIFLLSRALLVSEAKRERASRKFSAVFFIYSFAFIPQLLLSRQLPLPRSLPEKRYLPKYRHPVLRHQACQYSSAFRAPRFPGMHSFSPGSCP